MKRISAAWLSTLALLIGGIGLWERDGDIAHPFRVESGLEEGIAANRRDEDGVAVESALDPPPPLLEEQASEPRVLRPVGRFAERDIVEQQIRQSYPEDNQTTVFYLLANDSGSLPLVFLEETYESREGSSEIRLISQWAARGDEVMFDADPDLVPASELETTLQALDAYVSWQSRLSDFVQIKLRNPTIDAFRHALESLSQAFPKTTVSPDHLYFTTAAPSEFSPALHWHLDQVNAVDAWELETGSEEVVVGIIDTGASIHHPDLSENIFVNTGEIPGNGIDDDDNGFVDDVNGWDFVDDDAIPDDGTGHGTHVSGIAGARGDNGIGVSGVGWNIKILPLKVGDGSGLSSSAIAEALRYVSSLKESGVNLVATNNSYGSNAPNNVARTEIQKHEDLGILFVAAAGNQGRDIDSPDASQFPAGFPESNVISVANSTQSDGLSSGSNFGSESVDIAAPGKDIYSTSNGDSYEFLTGTSMSSPVVAGAVGLLASWDSSLDSRELKRRILETATPVESMRGKTVSGGRLDLLGALDPSLKGHEIEIPSHPGHLVLLPDTTIPVELETRTIEGTAIEVFVDGPENGVSVQQGLPGSFRFRFSNPGHYRAQFTATKKGVVRRAVRQFVVGSPPIDVPEGLIHAWDMEGTGSLLRDAAGQGDGELMGAARVNAPLGRGVDFAGSASRVRFTANASPSVTLSAFVRSRDLLSSPHPRIINMPDYYLYFSTRGVANLPDGNSNTLKFYSNRAEDFGVWNSPPDSIAEGEWLHVLASYDSTEIANTPRLYINGQEQPVRVQRLPVGTQTLDGGEAFLGDRAAGDRAWKGQMDEVRVYDRIIDPEEVSILAARYANAYWDQYSIRRLDDGSSGERLRLGLRNDSGNAPSGEFEWTLANAVEGVALEQEGSADVVVVATEKVNTQARVKAVGSMGTRYFTYDLVLDPPEIGPGVYTGLTESGGPVWVEVGDGLKSGYITMLDTDKEFRRMREPISIDPFGAFSSSSDLDQAIAGSIDGGLVGSVEDVGIQFSGEALKPPTSAFDFEGFYSGGAVGGANELVESRVSKEGTIFVWLHGSELDLAQGSVRPDGTFRLVSQLGSVVEGTIDAAAGKIDGSVSRLDRTAVLFMRSGGGESASRYVNLSSRGLALTGEKTLIGGFVLLGDGARDVLVRGLGPELASRGVPAVAADPAIRIFKNGEVVAANDDWESASNFSELLAFSDRVGASRLVSGSRDAAVLESLDPGVYTVFIESNQAGGEALFEVFDDAAEAGPALINVSTRGYVEGRKTPLIGGFVVNGSEPKLVLIRAVGGQALLDGGVRNPLADPSIEVYQGGSPIAFNDNWSDLSAPFQEMRSVQGPARSLIESFASAGAFPLDLGSKDAALLVWLDPGLYTVKVASSDGGSGIALVEVYQGD